MTDAEEIARLRKELDEANNRIKDFEADAKRYQYIKDNMIWRRYYGTLSEDDSHALVGCKFPYTANFGSAAMLDYNIDNMIRNEV